MIEEKIKKFRKIIIYRSTHTGTKESDLLFNKIIVENIEKLDFNELKELQSLFDHFSDSEIFSMIINNKYIESRIEKIFKKLNS
ncbi:MAG: hypothetical protein CFH16_00382 [Alphaproteobacteria bacterium MarineAlpha5_Bin6]|nr:MAG: hypothetical protein CFH17_01233 [Alphaproteobacteria bacterium MarineAlpha5_Bin7]PPR54509.1 MAG: hypothetical protein CFH16_00382 [Alphaproteobacteria bacterium MarineAlpha5_Bin6]|tara:strand:+ start:263 stop:514 length:252 start_codon:yes stop_codon:yes gene_type:complete